MPHRKSCTLRIGFEHYLLPTYDAFVVSILCHEKQWYIIYKMRGKLHRALMFDLRLLNVVLEEEICTLIALILLTKRKYDTIYYMLFLDCYFCGVIHGCTLP